VRTSCRGASLPSFSKAMFVLLVVITNADLIN
jgi:hypothetical protein